MLAASRISVVIALMGLECSCTVVTSCPTTPPAPSQGGGSNGGGNAGFGNTPAQFPEWTNVTSNLAGLASECGNMSFLSAKPDEDLLIAGVARVGLWSSTDGGQSWSLLGTGKGSDPLENRPSAIIYDPTHPATFWESGIYGAGVYKTTNDGRTIVRVGDVMHTDLLSIDFSDPARATFLAGGHEQANSLNLSTDSGSTWESVGSTLPESTNCTRPLVIDKKTFLVGCGGYGGGFVGIYRSTDGGAHFKELSKLGGVSPPLRTADGSIYWASGDSSLALSTDDGDTWTKMSANDVITGFTPAELPDGRIAALAQGNRGIALSADQGATWSLVAGPLPYNDPAGLLYSAMQKAFYVWRWDCSNFVPDDGILRSEFDYEVN